ncbi:MAG: S8 family serine peptidase, partial [Candidatus Berkiella sp.]
MGDLFPGVPGNNPEAVEPETREAAFTLNNEAPSPVQNGVVMLHIAEPVQANLDAILQQYNGTVLDGPFNGNSYWIKVDMTQIELGSLQSNLQTINTRLANENANEFILTTASFGNLESVKTFALIMELLLDEKITSANFNPIYQASGSGTTHEEPNPPPFTGGSVDAQDSWWLNDHSTRVTRAWDYSMGFNVNEERPVVVAVIDEGFAGLDRIINTPGSDLTTDNIAWQKGYKYSEQEATGVLPWLTGSTNRLREEDFWCNVTNCRRFPTDHGTRVISTLVSQVNNAKGITGTAPQIEIIPFKIGNGLSLSEVELRRLLYLVNDLLDLGSAAGGIDHIDVINMSLWSSANIFALDLASRLSNDTFLSDRLQLINKMTTEKNITFVGIAGNGSWDHERNMFAGPLFQGSVLTVGGVEDTNANQANSPQDLTRALLNLGTDFESTNKIRNHGSNYGSFGTHLHIWAPADNMAALGADINNNTVSNQGSIKFWNGTSAAAPIVSGVVAMMKARNPNLTTSQIIQILNNTAQTKAPEFDTLVREFPSLTTNAIYANSECNVGTQMVRCGGTEGKTIQLKVLNAEAALQASGATPYPIFTGKLFTNGSQIRFQDNANNQNYTLSWGKITDISKLRVLYGENVSLNPSSPTPIQLSTLLDTNQFVLVRGEVKNGKLYATNIQLGAAPPGSKQWKVKIFNTNDQVDVLVNNTVVLSHNSNSGSGFSNVDQFISGVDITPSMQAGQ